MTTHHSQENGSKQNRLVGWLVSYGLDDKGFVYELRAGRSLVTSERSVSARSLGLTEESISTPHLALKINSKHMVMVQDIFSDHGSFITRTNDEKEQPITGPTELRHGDWLRVGKTVRFQVCLIDGPTH